LEGICYEFIITFYVESQLLGETFDVHGYPVEVVEESYIFGAVVLDLEDAVRRTAEVGFVGGLEVVVNCGDSDPNRFEHAAHVDEVRRVVVVDVLGLAEGVQLVEGTVEGVDLAGEHFTGIVIEDHGDVANGTEEGDCEVISGGLRGGQAQKQGKQQDEVFVDY